MTDRPPRLVGVHEIAAQANVKVNTVHVWRQRHKDFPAPIVVLAMGPVWVWEDVETWMAARPLVAVAQ